MSKLKVEELTAWMFLDFYDRARRDDLLEVYHGAGYYFSDIKMSELNGALCLWDEETSKVYTIGGINDKGRIWMLCTDQVEKHPYTFLKFCKKYLKVFQKQHYMLWNYVWLGNDLHVRWLKWMGATFERTIDVRGEKFQAFYFVNTKE